MDNIESLKQEMLKDLLNEPNEIPSILHLIEEMIIRAFHFGFENGYEQGYNDAIWIYENMK